MRSKGIAVRFVLVAALSVLAMSLGVAPARAQQPLRLDRPFATRTDPMTVLLDARKAPIGVAYTHMTIPVAPGPFTLVYPEWIPGEHSPSGPLQSMAELRMSANGVPLRWQRDQVDLYAFHVNVPRAVRRINVDYTVLLNTDFGGTMASRNIMVGNWNRYILYQRNVDNQQYFVRPSLIMPQGWDFASALPSRSRAGDRVDFNTVTLETLVDSPTDIGRYVRHVTTWSGDGAATYLDLFADAPEDLKIDDKVIAGYRRLTPEAMALYGGRHWNVYHAELTLSDAIGFAGIEHHESSDDRAGDSFLSDADQQTINGDLIPHEFSHSWNGKYRRPYGLQQPNFNEPYAERTELMWQYEGMNQYMGDLLSFRAGIRDPKDYPEFLAALYASLAYEPGRKTTPLSDTTIGAPYYYCCASGWYPSIRRTAGDFYREGELIWLDADTIIRQETRGAKSLDDYTKMFAGGVSSPRVVTYTRAEIEGDLSRVAPYDWHAFFQRYVYSIAPEPPTDEIARAGYRLVYNDKPNKFGGGRSAAQKNVNSWFDLGVELSGKGVVEDVRQDSAAWSAGVAPGMHIVAVNDRAFDPDLWTAAIADAKGTTQPIRLRIKQGGWYASLSVAYHDGRRYPHLERVTGTADMLAEIMRPHATAPPKNVR